MAPCGRLLRAPVVSPPVLSQIRSSPFRALLLPIAAALGRHQSASLLLHRVLPSGWWRVGREFLRDGVGRDRQRTAVRGGPVLAMESLATWNGCGWRRVGGRGVSVVNNGAYMARRSPDRAGDWKTCTIGLLPSCPRLGNYVKLALSFAKLPKIQTSNTKLLDTLFCDFWQITRMQIPYKTVRDDYLDVDIVASSTDVHFALS